MKISWFRTHIRLTVIVVSITLLLAASVIVFAGYLPFTHASVPATGGASTDSWAGNEADAAPGTYTTVSMQFTVPTITGSPGDTVSVWAGLGGGPSVPSSATLVQAGVDLYVDSTGQQTNIAWWDVPSAYPSEQTISQPGAINAGDTIDVTVASNWLGSNADSFSITDEATGQTYAPHSLTNSAVSDGATAECIVARPGAAGLAEFNSPSNTLNINNCLVYTDANNSATGIGNVPHSSDTMSNSDGTEAAAPGAISDDGNSFPVNWYSAGTPSTPLPTIIATP